MPLLAREGASHGNSGTARCPILSWIGISVLHQIARSLASLDDSLAVAGWVSAVFTGYKSPAFWLSAPGMSPSGPV